RFDDIWSGVFLKRAADLLDKQLYNGKPLCEHNKAPRSTFGDLANEVAGLELNEHVWELADRVSEADSFADAFERMAEELLAADAAEYENGEFLTYVGEHMHDWLDCLEALDADGLESTGSARSVADD
ncbi:MAG: alpha-1 4-glucan-protein synthase, partial [Halapricum sp.]